MRPGKMPTSACPGVMRPGQLGPMRRTPFCRTNCTASIMSCTGMPSVMQTMSSMPLSAASRTASAAYAAGTDDGAVGARRVHGLLDRVKHGHAQHLLPALARRHAADHLGAVGQHLAGVELALPAGNSLND